MIVEYVGLAEVAIDGYTIFFHDFPGCGSAGDDLNDLRKNAKEGLFAHIELMLMNREKIPKPTSLDEILQLPEAQECIPIIIPIILPSGKAQRINITIDSNLLNAIDKIAETQHKSRSAFIAEAAQRLLEVL